MAQQLVRELVHSAFGGNNLVPSHLKLRETILIGRNVSKAFVTGSSGITKEAKKEASSTEVFIT